MAPLHALVTAGGTRERIDDVRVITNLSRGRFGAAIARELSAAGVRVTVLGSRAALELLEDDPVERVRFDSYADLARELERLTQEPPDLLFMAAAVSDYAPVPQSGKIRSTTDELTIKLQKTKKILSGLRERCGVETFLVGFKLLSNVPRTELVQTALGQVRACRLNLTVANDLMDFTDALHPVSLVTPEGGALRVEGPRREVARRLVAFVLRRQAVTWARSEADPAAVEPDASFPRAKALLALAQDANLLTHAPDGNITARGEGGRFWATPRQVDKASLGPDDLLQVSVDLDARRVRYRGSRRASIDCSVHAQLYAELADLDTLLHFHGALVLPDRTTRFPYPCGTREEADEVLGCLAQGVLERGGPPVPFAIELVDHGFLVGLEPGGTERLGAQWESAVAAYDAHLQSIGEDREGKTLTPVFVGGTIVGLRSQGAHGGERWTSVFLLESARGGRLGARLLERLDRAGDLVAVHDGCGVLGFYLAHGYGVREREGQVSFLVPPSRRDDVIEAASVCLFEPATRRVLVGQRKTPPRVGTWSFPGGRLREGESHLAAARRELREETGLGLPGRTPHAERVSTAGSEDGQVAFRVTCFTALTLSTPAPTPTDELDARWMPLNEALALDLAPGTRAPLLAL